MDVTTGDILRACRKRAGLSIHLLSERTGIAKKTIYQYEEDLTSPNLSKYEDLLSAMGYELLVVEKGVID